MNFSEFESRLEFLLEGPLPGSEAHYKLAPINRKGLDLKLVDKTKVKRAAVAALFFDLDNSPHLVLTLRNKYPGVHSGQISFPGGKREKEDLSYQDTALRETYEEIGIAKSEIIIHRHLSELYIPPSNFLVQPFLGTISGSPIFVPEEKEVNEILSLDFNRFMDPSNVKEVSIKTGNHNLKVPAFSIDGHTIWGATAMMINELIELFSKER